MTEHSVTDNIDRLPSWHEQLLFAEELNECMLAGCTGYIYWYMRAHWAFVSTGEAKYGTGNKIKNRLLPRAYVMSHFSKNVTGSTRLETKASVTTGTNSFFENSAYIKDDSLLIVMAIDTTATAYDLKLRLPYKVKSGVHLLSTSNESLCQETSITIDEPVDQLTVSMPERSLNTYIFTIAKEEPTGITNPQMAKGDPLQKRYFDLQGRSISQPEGLCIEQRADGTAKKVYVDKRK